MITAFLFQVGAGEGVMASDHQIENNTSLDTFINALDEINNLNTHIKDIIDKIGVKYLNPKI